MLSYTTVSLNQNITAIIITSNYKNGCSAPTTMNKVYSMQTANEHR